MANAIINFYDFEPTVFNILKNENCSTECPSESYYNKPTTDGILHLNQILAVPAPLRNTSDPNNQLFGIMVDPVINGISVFKLVDENLDNNEDHIYKIKSAFHRLVIWEPPDASFKIDRLEMKCKENDEGNMLSYLFVIGELQGEYKEYDLYETSVKAAVMGPVSLDPEFSNDEHIYLCLWKTLEGECQIVRRYPEPETSTVEFE